MYSKGVLSAVENGR